MAEYNHLDHAEHNDKVCSHLIDNTEYSDWIITTAFYSAMHYMRHVVFPLKVKNDKGEEVEAKNFDHYCLIIDQSSRKHNTLRKLVENNCPSDISAAYNQMLDASWTARYSKYKFSKKIADLARKRLVVIKNHSKRIKPPASEDLAKKP